MIFNLSNKQLIFAIIVGLILSAAIVAIVSSSTNYTKPEVKPVVTVAQPAMPIDNISDMVANMVQLSVVMVLMVVIMSVIGSVFLRRDM